jgi:alpha-tubulin suppressor-like RCC1 family protein
MSSVNVSNFILQLQEKINSSTDEKEILYLSKAVQQLRMGAIYVVNSFTDLPEPGSRLGDLFFVINDSTLYYAVETNLYSTWKTVTNTERRLLFTWGRTGLGQSGNGSGFVLGDSPVQELCSDITWCQVVTDQHTLALKTGGTLWAWGAGSAGQHGDGTGLSKCSPVQEFCSDTTWCQLSVGQNHSNAVKTNGTLWVWGCGGSGRLGDGTELSKCSPVQEFCSGTTWCQVNAGSLASSAVKTDGTLWSWGSGGRTGDGTNTARCSPVQEFCSDTTWTQVSTGCLHTLAVKSGGTLWAWGTGSMGELGVGTTPAIITSPVQEICSDTNWCQVSSGSCFSTAVKTDGTIWAWGLGTSGQLGDGTTTNSCSPVQEWCSNTTWCQISVGIQHAVAIKTDGTIWSWGAGAFYRLGLASDCDNKCSPVQEICNDPNWCFVSAGTCHTSAINFKDFCIQ